MVRIRGILKSLVAFTVTALVTVVFIHQVLVQKTLQSRFKHVMASLGSQPQEFAECKPRFTVAVWDKEVNMRTFENVLDFPKFPYYPDGKYRTDSWQSAVETTQLPCIKRIRTRLRPPESGFYQFRVRENGPTRMFLETSPGEVRRILESVLKQNGEKFLKSEAHLLYDNYSYYFEVQLFCLPGEDAITIEWLVPGGTMFEVVRSSDFTCGNTSVSPFVPESPVLPPDRHHLLSFIPKVHLAQSFPKCNAVNHTMLNRFDQKTVVYTPPGTPPAGVQEGVQAVISALEAHVPKKYPSFEIRKVESTQALTQGHLRRFLVDLQFTVDGLDYKQRMSEYFLGYYHDNSLTLCRPTSYKWNPVQTLNFVFIAECHGNQSVWVDYFIKNMAQLLQTSLDVNFKVIVTTCDDRQAKLYESRLRASVLERHSVVLLEGAYTESRALKAAISLVEKENSVVVLCRSRVYMPTAIFEEIRKHTFERTMAYLPVPFQLNHGYFPSSGHVEGYWCPRCLGLVALHTNDWKNLLDNSLKLKLNGKQKAYPLFKDKEDLLRQVSESGIEMIQINLNAYYRL